MAPGLTAPLVINYYLLTPATVEPVTLAELKVHLRLDLTDTSEDAMLGVLIGAARQQAEEYTRRSFLTQTWRMTMDTFPIGVDPLVDVIRFPRGPVQSVTSVKYIDINGVTQTWDTANYFVDLHAVPPFLTVQWAVIWPITRGYYQRNAVTIDYVTGFGDAPADVPAPIRQALLLICGDLYQNKEASIVGTIWTENPAVKALLDFYRLPEFR